MYACSILYKYKLPFIVAMNKIDVVNHKYALEWMNDFEVSFSNKRQGIDRGLFGTDDLLTDLII